MASEPRIQTLLASVDLFHGLGEAHLDAIAALTKRQTCEPGRMVIRQGEPSDSLHLVESGTYEVFYWDDLLRIERPFNSLGRGDVFGEMGVLSGEPRSASVRCRDAGATIILGKEDFLQFLDEHSRAAVALAKTLAQAGHRRETDRARYRSSGWRISRSRQRWRSSSRSSSSCNTACSP
jgi:CPA1 family monovalent cation:H+ antiporter